MPRAAKALDQVEHLHVVDAAHDHAVELDLTKTGALGGGDACEHFAHLAAPAGQRAEGLRIERIQ